MNAKRFLLQLLVFVCIAGTLFAQNIKNSGPPNIVVDQTQYLAYWTDEPNWHSELQLRNNSTSGDLVVTPSLRSATGTETPLKQITIKPQEVAAVDIREAISSATVQPSTAYGSIVVRYKAFAQSVLYAAVMIHRMARPIAFHIDGVGQLDADSDSYREGLWWRPLGLVDDYLVLTG